MGDLVSVQLSRKAFEFLTALAKRIETQDNRGTAKPYFLITRTKKWRVTKEGYGQGNTRTIRVDHDGDPTVYTEDQKSDFMRDYCSFDPDSTVEEREKEFQEHEVKWERLEQFEEEECFEEDNCFLTDEGYKQHVELNGHNLKRHGQHDSYLKHAFRNPEMTGLFEAIAEFGSLSPKVLSPEEK